MTQAFSNVELWIFLVIIIYNELTCIFLAHSIAVNNNSNPFIHSRFIAQSIPVSRITFYFQCSYDYFLGHYEDALAFANIRPLAISPPNMHVTVPSRAIRNEEEPLIDAPPGLDENDPLNIDDVRIKEEDLPVFKLNEADANEVNGIMDDPPLQDTSNNENDASSSIGAANGAILAENSDDDIVFAGEVMPKPMASMRNGLIKHEDDNISGGLPYKPTVRFVFAINNMIFLILFHPPFRTKDACMKSTEHSFLSQPTS